MIEEEKERERGRERWEGEVGEEGGSEEARS